jgi:hypothetical protein
MRAREAAEPERSARGMAPDGKHSADPQKALSRVGVLDAELGRLPARVLEGQIGRTMGQLLPQEIKRFTALVSEPPLAIAYRLREMRKDAVLGREEARG